MEPTIRDFTQGDLEGVFTLYAEVFGQEALQRFRKRFRWQFYMNPATILVPSRMWVAEADGTVVGYLGSFPVRLKFGDEELVYHCPCDLMVSEQARGHGLAQRLNESYLAATKNLATAFAYSPAAGRLYHRMGFQRVRAEPFRTRPVNFLAIARGLRATDRLPAFATRTPAWWPVLGVGAALHVILAAANVVRRPRASRDHSVERTREAGVGFDELWRISSPHFPIVGVRDRSFVQWRFLDDPNFEHHLLVARDRSGALAGYLDYCLTRRRGLVVGRIVDLFCPPSSSEVVTSLLGCALEALKKAGVAIVECMGLHPAIQSIVGRHLYVRRRSVEVPALLLWMGEERLRGFVYDQDNWHLSYADGDEGFSP